MLKSRKARKGHAQASYDGMKRRGDLPAFLEEYKGNYDWETFKERYKLRMTHDRFRLLIRKDEDQDVKEAHRQRNDKWRRAGHYPDPQSVHTQSATDGETGTVSRSRERFTDPAFVNLSQPSGMDTCTDREKSSKESAHRQAKTASRAKSASGAPSAVSRCRGAFDSCHLPPCPGPTPPISVQ